MSDQSGADRDLVPRHGCLGRARRPAPNLQLERLTVRRRGATRMPALRADRIRRPRSPTTANRHPSTHLLDVSRALDARGGVRQCHRSARRLRTQSSGRLGGRFAAHLAQHAVEGGLLLVDALEAAELAHVADHGASRSLFTQPTVSPPCHADSVNDSLGGPARSCRVGTGERPCRRFRDPRVRAGRRIRGPPVLAGGPRTGRQLVPRGRLRPLPLALPVADRHSRPSPLGLVPADCSRRQLVAYAAASDDLRAVARLLVNGLRHGRRCLGAGTFQVSLGVFPPNPDGGLPLPVPEARHAAGGITGPSGREKVSTP